MADRDENITLKDVWIEVRRLQDTVLLMTPQAQTLADHENRIRAGERWRYALPIGLVIAMGSVGATVADLATRK